jgi:hypothetical protein
MTLKRLGLIVLFLFGLVPGVLAIDNYWISPETNTRTAGTPFSLNIMARDGVAKDTGYTHTANLTVSSGAGSYIVTNPISFVSGDALNIPITITAAGAITITLTDSTATTVTSIAGVRLVSCLAPQRMLFLRYSSELMEYQTPGIDPGYKEIHGYNNVTPTISSGIPMAVSMVVIDQYFNAVTGTAADSYQIQVGGDFNFLSTVVNPMTGMAPFYCTPTAISEGALNFNIMAGPLPAYHNANYAIIPNTTYMWVDAPTTVVAGAPFYITVAATNMNTRNSTSSTWVNNYTFSLNPKLVDGSGNPGHGTLSPTQATLMNGSINGTYTYQSAESIRLVPVLVGSVSGKTFLEGGYQVIQVTPSVPYPPLTVSVSPASIQAQKTAVISATVRDAYLNPVPSALVTFTKTAGSSDSTVSPATVVTNASGLAQAMFTGGIINEIATVQVTVGTIAQNVEIRISVAPPTGGDMINYPNPFNPNSQKTSVNYYLKAESEVDIKIYDAFGRVVLNKSLKPGQGSGDFFNATAAGGASFLWDGRNGEGHMVGNGIYQVKVAARNSIEAQNFTRRVGVLK